ncbi:MAG: ABC transporter ATP-binding protein [Janthinobacterium lividum]
MTSENSLLSVENLSIAFDRKRVVHDVSFHIFPQETLALVGESGSGKSITALSILKLLPYPLASHPEGRILWQGQDLLQSSDQHVRRVRGRQIAMIFQEPMTSLNPLHTVEKQIKEALKIHGSPSTSDHIQELLQQVQLKNVTQKMKAYPHQLSGGERQRVMIAMALAGRPSLLIADEPTTALDVTTQAEILKLLQGLQQQFNMSLLLITHDLSLVRRMAQRVVVMEKGQVVEQGRVQDIFTRPQHPYTQCLLAAEETDEVRPVSDTAKVLLQTEKITVSFPLKSNLWQKKSFFTAVDGISFSLRAGETLGVVGESGSGKSTLALALLRLVPFQGQCRFQNQALENLSSSQMRSLRRNMQIVFQDPYGALSPRMTVEEIIAEGLEVHEPTLTSQERMRRLDEVLQEVGLDHVMKGRYPHEFSGGQRQRLAIARALILKPQFLILDEPTSALDRAIQVDILKLLKRLQTEHGMAYLFISHDLKTVQAISHKVMVMKEGKVVEFGPKADIFLRPQHLYTQRLMKAAFDMDV